MTKRFSTVYNICLCQRCGSEFECWGGCPDICTGCEAEVLEADVSSLDKYDGVVPDSEDDWLQYGEPDDPEDEEF